MLTKKKLMIPIFDYSLTIIIFDDWKELEGYLSKEAFSEPCKGITTFKEGAALVAINAARGSTIVHESLHVVNGVWNYIGYEPVRDNDEVSAYLLTYIYDKIVDVFYNHKGNHE